MGTLIKREIRTLDILGREGDRFFLALPETDLLGSIHLAGRVKDLIDRSAIDEFGTSPRFAALVGVASCPDVVDNPHQLVEAAEDAVLQSRHSGDFRMALCERKVA